jgi:hypothetical protein
VLSLITQDHPDVRIFDAVSDPTASGYAACLSANNAATAGVTVDLAPAGHTDHRGPLPDASPLQVLPHLLGKHILYFERVVSAYEIYPPYMGEKGTRVLHFLGGFQAVGY